jgi:hypothetical protein
LELTLASMLRGGVAWGDDPAGGGHAGGGAAVLVRRFGQREGGEVTRRLMSAGSIWIEDDFLPDSRALCSVLVASIAWDERMRARKVASFGVPYNYSGTIWPEAPFPGCLTSVLEDVSKRLAYRPNNCLAHYYPDGGSSMGFHADATDELEQGTGIAIVSLGAERRITFRKEQDRRVVEEYALKSGSLLFMCPEMQLAWQHAILAAKGVSGGRVSLTFRRVRQGGPEADR